MSVVMYTGCFKKTKPKIAWYALFFKHVNILSQCLFRGKSLYLEFKNAQCDITVISKMLLDIEKINFEIRYFHGRLVGYNTKILAHFNNT